jgi:hypothetical protein
VHVSALETAYIVCLCVILSCCTDMNIQHPMSTDFATLQSEQASLTFLEKYPSLLASVSSIARTSTTLHVQAQSGANEMRFVSESVKSSRVTVSDCGTICTFTGRASTIFVGPVLMPGSGVHYVEYEVLECGCVFVCCVCVCVCVRVLMCVCV